MTKGSKKQRWTRLPLNLSVSNDSMSFLGILMETNDRRNGHGSWKDGLKEERVGKYYYGGHDLGLSSTQ